MPTEETDPATEPFLAGTDQRDHNAAEPDGIRLRSLPAVERDRVTAKVRPASDYCKMAVRGADLSAHCDQPRRGAISAARPSRRTLVLLALAVVLLSLFPLRHRSLHALLLTASEQSARYNKECVLGHESSCSKGLPRPGLQMRSLRPAWRSEDRSR